MNTLDWPIDAKEFDGQPTLEPNLAAAQVALNGQLLHTAELIKTALTDHPHFTDDCGEYLRGALELSASLMIHRENGPEALEERFKEMITENLYDWPSDSISTSVYEYMESLGWMDEYR